MSDIELEQFPPFGEDLRDAENNPIVVWDFDRQVRIQYNEDGTTTERPFSEDEASQIAAKTEAINQADTEESLLAKAASALDSNRAWLGRSTAPTNAQTLQQVDRLTRQINALIMLQRRDFTNTNGT